MYSSVHLQRLTSQEALPSFPVSLDREGPRHHSFLFIIDHGASELDRMIVAVTARKLVPHAHVYIADANQTDIEDWEGIFYLPMYCGGLPRVGLVTAVAVFHDSKLAIKAAESYPKAEVFLISHDLMLPEALGYGPARAGAMESHLG